MRRIILPYIILFVFLLLPRDRLEGTALTENQQQLDVVYYGLTLEVFPETVSLAGYVDIAAKCTGNKQTFMEIDLLGVFVVDGITSDGDPLNYTHTDDLISIQLDRTYSVGEEIRVRIHYHGIPPKHTDDPPGVLFYEIHDGIHPIICTICQLEGAFMWWPCKDYPGDKADSVNINVTVPEELTVASNGILREVIHEDGKKTFRWHHGYPIVTYNVALNITNYANFSDFLILSSGDTLRMEYYVCPANLNTAMNHFQQVKEIVPFYSDLFCPFPFIDEKLGIAETVWGGGMEHQTIIAYGNEYRNSSTYVDYDLLLVHELAHEWFGNMISLKEWGHAWLNEGFATYCEALFIEEKYGKDEYRRYMGSKEDKLSSLTENAKPLFCSDSTSVEEVWYGHIYVKGAWVLHALRHVVGDEVFFDILKTYCTDSRYKYKTASTYDFRRVCEEVSGMNLGWFFTQWVFGVGRPSYTYSWETSQVGAEYRVQLRINQLGDIFKMPIDVTFESAAQEMTVTVWDSLSSQDFQFDIPFEPSALVLDKNHWFLNNIEEISDDPVSDDPSREADIINYTNTRKINALADDGECIWMATDGGALRWHKYEKTFTKYTSTDGLPGNGVNTVAVDKEGNAWFGTKSGGACKFDGYAWTTYDSRSPLSDNLVKDIVIDDNNNKWFVTTYNIKKFDDRYWQAYTEYNGLIGHYIRDIAYDKEGCIWVSAYDFQTGMEGVSRFDGVTWQKYTSDDYPFLKDIIAIAVDQYGNRWFGSFSGGLCKFDGAEWMTFPQAGNIDALSANGSGNVWAATSTGVKVFDGSIWSVIQIDRTIYDIMIDSEGVAWFATNDGLVEYRNSDLTYYSTFEEGIPANGINSVNFDEGGILWAATDNGVGKFDGAQWHHYTMEDGLIYNNLTAVEDMPDGTVWIGTYWDGICRWEDDAWNSMVDLDMNYYNHSWITDITVDKENCVWFSSRTGGISKYDGTEWIEYSIDYDLSIYHANDAALDIDGSLWFAFGGKGVSRFDGLEWFHYPDADDMLCSSCVLAVAVDRDGDKWFGTPRGLTEWNDGTKGSYTANDGLSNTHIKKIYVDSHGDIWVGTLEGGINKFDGQVWTSWDVRDGLASNEVNSIAEDNDGNIWVATPEGLSVIQNVVTSVRKDQQIIRDQYILHQNYPNPFNHETTIKYSIPKREVVDVHILNIKGQIIKVLVSSEMVEMGEYAVVWDGTDDGNRMVASGIYLIRMKAGEYVVSKRISFIK